MPCMSQDSPALPTWAWHLPPPFRFSKFSPIYPQMTLNDSDKGKVILTDTLKTKKSDQNIMGPL